MLRPELRVLAATRSRFLGDSKVKVNKIAQGQTDNAHGNVFSSKPFLKSLGFLNLVFALSQEGSNTLNNWIELLLVESFVGRAESDQTATRRSEELLRGEATSKWQCDDIVGT